MPRSFAFILGAPRSGTTLLRALIGSHSRVLALPETPWLLGSYGPPLSLRHLRQRMIEDSRGAVANIRGISADDVDRACRSFVNALFGAHMDRVGGGVLLFKTPDDARYLDDLLTLFPDARYIHITRDGRDVTLSTMSHYPHLSGYGKATAENCLRRWSDFEDRIRSRLGGQENYLSVRYEDLVLHPEPALRSVAGFIEVEFEQAMLTPDLTQDLPQWEKGSTDVRRAGAQIEARIGRYKDADRVSVEQRRAFNAFNARFEELGYPAFRYRISVTEAAGDCARRSAQFVRSVGGKVLRALHLR